jgi:osmotically-inducible protein OsmY
MNTASRLLFTMFVAAALAGCAATPTRESTGQTFDSAWITSQVKSRLFADPATSGMRVSVETFRNVVQLSGFATASEMRRAVEIARSVPGVQEVRNDIVVRQ